MPAEFGDPSDPGFGPAGVQSGGYVEKAGFSLSDIPKVPYQQLHPTNCNRKSLVGYMPAKFGDPSCLGLVTAGGQRQGYVSR